MAQNNIYSKVGPRGRQGVPGKSDNPIFIGSGPPSTIRNDGDLYLNQTTGDIYQQNSSSWGSPVCNIKGPAGGALARYSNSATPATLVQVGSSAVWTLSVPFTASAMVFRNGLLLSPGGDYTTNGNQITFFIAPSASDNLIVME